MVHMEGQRVVLFIGSERMLQSWGMNETGVWCSLQEQKIFMFAACVREESILGVVASRSGPRHRGFCNRKG
jgi:hypothetical protein